MAKFKGLLSDKQSFAFDGAGYRSGNDGCFITDNEEIIAFLRISPFWEEVKEPKTRKSEQKSPEM